MEKLNQKEKIKKTIEEEEEVKIKLLHKVKYTNKEILLKALKINMKNWKNLLILKLYQTLFDMINIYIPISQGKLIDNIASLKNFEESLNSFKNYVLILIIKFIISYVSYIINSKLSTNEEKKKNYILLLNKIVEKDLFFFEIYKTGELVGKINDLKHGELDILEVLFDIIRYSFKIFIISYYLINSSFYLTAIFFILFILSNIANKFLLSLYSQEDVSCFFKNISRARNKINELFTNIKMIKSFAKEKEEVKEYEKNLIKKTKSDNIKFCLHEITTLINQLEYPILLIFVGKFILEENAH